MRRGLRSSRESRACISSWAAKHPRPQHASKAGTVHAAASGSPRDRGPRISGRVPRCRPHAVQYWAIQQIRFLTGTPCTEPGLHCRRVCVTPLVGGVLRNPSLRLSCAPLNGGPAISQDKYPSLKSILKTKLRGRNVLCSGRQWFARQNQNSNLWRAFRQAVRCPAANENHRYAGPSPEPSAPAEDLEGCRNSL